MPHAHRRSNMAWHAIVMSLTDHEENAVMGQREFNRAQLLLLFPMKCRVHGSHCLSSVYGLARC